MNAGDRVIFVMSGTDREDLLAHDCEAATIVRPLDDTEADLLDVGPMYRIRFDDDFEGAAFEDELTLVD